MKICRRFAVLFISRSWLLAGLLPLLEMGQVQAETRYVTDMVYVPVRAGPGSQYRIIHQGLRTGTQMQVLEADVGDGFSKIVTSAGLEGFVRTQYLVREKPARDVLPEERNRNASLMKENQQLKASVAEKDQQLATLRASYEASSRLVEDKTSELVALREATADPQALDRRNKQLMEENQLLKSRVEVVTAENSQLVRDSSLRWYLYGGGTIVIGILLGLILPLIRFKKKPSADWV